MNTPSDLLLLCSSVADTSNKRCHAVTSQPALEVSPDVSVCACRAPQDVQKAALPPDASCEDLEIDASLPFLNSYVQQALNNGAAPYIPEEQRMEMGFVRPSHHEEAHEHSHALRFAAYEKTAAPSAAAAAAAAAPVTSAVPQSIAQQGMPARSASPQLHFGESCLGAHAMLHNI